MDYHGRGETLGQGASRVRNTKTSRPSVCRVRVELMAPCRSMARSSSALRPVLEGVGPNGFGDVSFLDQIGPIWVGFRFRCLFWTKTVLKHFARKPNIAYAARWHDGTLDQLLFDFDVLWVVSFCGWLTPCLSLGLGAASGILWGVGCLPA